jgi:FkbM family methyltransferase
MNDLKRVPTVESLLSQLRGLDLDVRNVVDVGVLSGTGFLVEYFPKAKHHLFEPVDRFFDVIRAGYQGLEFDLHHLAVSSTSGMAFQVGVSADGSARVTHSYVSVQERAVGEITGQGVVIECKPVKTVSLDEFFGQTPLEGNYLLKIDVDGHEMPIIEGAQATVAGADLVIVEATMPTLLERANAISKLGFELLEVVDLCYYHRLLSQVDLIFVNRRVIKRHADLHPWATKTFSFEQWYKFAP